MLTSPVNQYQPQVLLLAPKQGEDLNTLSMMAQFLEMGVAVELDENWRLPTEPPRDLSAYRACVLPDTAENELDKELTKYVEAGGFVPYFRYFPTQYGGGMSGVHHFFESFGRDAYFFHCANVVLEAGFDLPDQDFREVLQQRDAQNMLDEVREPYVDKYSKQEGPWSSWGDPQYTQFLTCFESAMRLDDPQWLEVVTRCLQRLNDTVPHYLENHVSYQEIKRPDVVQCHAAIMAEVLMTYGHQLGRDDFVETGIKLARFYVDHGTVHDGYFHEAYHRQVWSENLYSGPALFGLGRFLNDPKYHELALSTMRLIAENNLQPDGLWRHWSDSIHRHSLIWSRGNSWPVTWMTRSILIIEDKACEASQYLLGLIRKTFEGLRQHQDLETGLWRLVVDDPHTRIETSAVTQHLYCHAVLRSQGLIGDEYNDMFDEAYQGMKCMWYRGGLAGNCRGTASGNDHYYRTRPIGYYDKTLFPYLFADRLAQ